MRQTIVGITVDNRENTAGSGQYESTIAYSRAVAEAGAVPVLLPHEPTLVDSYVQLCHALIFTGGVDPDTTAFGEPMHPKARPMDQRRQAFELALLDAVDRARRPALGVCLGMQLMALHAGGHINQYLPDTLASHEPHRQSRRHPIVLKVFDSVLGDDAHSMVVSSHQQAVDRAGSMRVVAVAPDGVIEAIDKPGRDFYLGVQWHPERGGNEPLNRGLIARLVQAASTV